MQFNVSPVSEEPDIPSTSVLNRRLIESAYFRDFYRVPLCRPRASAVDIFCSIFAHHPMYMKIALIVRNKMVSCFGLDAPTARSILQPQFKNSYAVGDKIGVWPILYLSDTELIVGRDDKHLDFRLSVLRVPNDETTSVVVSTICLVHNVFGKLYLFFVIPFHRWGVKRIMANAVSAGRL